MANTTNLDLVKPAGTDHALISVLNSNSDKIDAFAGQTNDSLSAEQNGLAYIVGNTNTTGGTLAVGQFVYVKGHSTIPEGLRKVTSSISANGSITTSNTDACSEGGLNALNSKFAPQDFVSLVTQDTTWQWIACVKVGNVCYITGRLSYVEIGTSDTKVLTLPSGYRPAYNVCSPTVALDGSGAAPAAYGVCQINSNGEMLIRNNANGYYNYVNISYVV